MAGQGDAGLDPAALRRWVGRAATAQDRIDAWQVAAMHAALDCDGAAPGHGAPLPEGWHWLFFRETEPARGLDADGHAARGGFLPPVPGRRMWAGGRLTFAAPLRVGAEVSRRSAITDVAAKQGRSGQLVFVTVAHEIGAGGTAAVLEEQDLVYRGGSPAGVGSSAGGGRGARAVAAPCWTRMLTPDPVLLFRYSALTFNGHRIHYDADYARSVEGYPGLVVHGPLIATFLMDLIRRNAGGRGLATFAYRAVAPLFCGEALRLEAGVDRADGDGLELAAAGPGGRVVMTANARLADSLGGGER